MSVGLFESGSLEKKIELYYFSDDLSRSWIGRSERRFENRIDTGGCERVVLLDLFSAIRVDIYKPSIISQTTMLVKVAEEYCEKVKWASSFEKGAESGGFRASNSITVY